MVEKKYILGEAGFSSRPTVYVWWTANSQINYKVNSHKTQKTILGKLEGVLGEDDGIAGLFHLLVECRNNGYDFVVGETAPEDQ